MSVATLLEALSWPAVGSLLSGLLSLSFVGYLWPYRRERGAIFFIGTIACVALWAVAYGVALVVFDPGLRALFEVPIWLGINFVGVFFLAFALEYTGRGHLVRSKFVGAIVGLQLLHSGVVLTNPLHQVAWSNYRVDPMFGAATVSYAHQPWLFVNFVGIYIMVAAASFLLVDTFFSYGRLYRGQTAAIAVSPILPGLTFTLWLFEIGGFYPLNLTPLAFPVHLGLDMYAFFRRNMFELTPAARRASERTAIDDLGSAVVVVDDDRWIVNANDEARLLLDTDGEDLVGRRLGTVVDGIDVEAADRTVSLAADGRRRDYAVTTAPIDDSTGRVIGRSLVFQDVTVEKQREQRLSVLNRVLRHNLRNDLSVVRINTDVARERTADDEIRDLLAEARATTADLLAVSDQVRTIERVLDAETAAVEAVPVRSLLEDLSSELREDRPDARIEIDVPRTLRLQADQRLLGQIFRNLVENGIVHDESDAPRVEVAVVDAGTDDHSVTFEVRDDGPGIPDHERSVIEAGTETPLEHGSGLGLWIVRWGVDVVGGDVRFEPRETGTTVVLRLPAPSEPAGTAGNQTDDVTTG